MENAQFLREIAVPIDLEDPGRELLFAHGLKLALGSEGVMTLIHASEGEQVDWLAIPTVREMLQRWGLIEEGATSEDFERLGVRVRPVNLSADDKVEALHSKVSRLEADLLVVGHRDRNRWQRLMKPGVGEAVVRKTAVPCLFIGERARGLVDPATGEARLVRVLMPVDGRPSMPVLIETVERLIATLGIDTVRVTFLFCGVAADLPIIALPEHLDWQHDIDLRAGPIVDTIVTRADELGVDLVAMSTSGQDSLVDLVIGSRTERVIHRSSVPVLAVLD